MLNIFNSIVNSMEFDEIYVDGFSSKETDICLTNKRILFRQHKFGLFSSMAFGVTGYVL